MVSNQILQNTLAGFVKATHIDAAVCDIYGKIIAEEGNIGEINEAVINNFFRSSESRRHVGDWVLLKIHDNTEIGYIAVARASGENTDVFLNLLGFQLESIIEACKEKVDKESFYKNLLLDNLLQVDIYNRARKLEIEYKQPRVVFLILSQGRELQVSEALSTFIEQHSPDMLLSLSEDNQLAVHDIKNINAAEEELAAYAKDMLTILEGAGISATVSYGGIAGQIGNLSKSFKEAKLADDIRNIFHETEKISSYEHLGIGRVIYQLPLNLCKMFINEIFKGKSPEDFDEETIVTIGKFFDNNLNVSETSRQLFIHRNTLVYRLDKLQKMTGLDLRNFDDAITFKIALMVVKYMDYMSRIEY